jgi:hypothetical protein
MGRKQLEIDFNLSGSRFSKVPSSSATSLVFCPVAPAWTLAARTASERRRRRVLLLALLPSTRISSVVPQVLTIMPSYACMCCTYESWLSLQL